MTDLHAADDHATPLTPGEREDLIPTHITLRSELNELEQQNIATANRWTSNFQASALVSGDRASTRSTQLHPSLRSST
jgi:hypothetical protein